MNQLATTEERLPMNTVGMAGSSTGAKIAPQNLGEVVKFAEVMCRADIALPKHLRGNAGACMAVALQALEWQLSPFAVASKSYAVNGSIAYEAQLIAAVVNTRSGIKGRLKYHFEGKGNDLTCTVTGMLDGEECSYTSPTIGSITTKNSPLWKSDPQQQLGYFSARSWARRHVPEVILGVYDRDEAEQFRGPDNARDVTPDRPSLAQRFAKPAQEPYDGSEGFNGASIAYDDASAPTAASDDNSASSDPDQNRDEGSETVEHDAPTGEDDGESADEPSSSDMFEDSAGEPPSPDRGTEGGEAPPPASSPSTLSAKDRSLLIECAFKLFGVTTDERLTTPQERRGVLATTKDAWKKALPAEHHDRLKAIFLSVDAVIKGDQDRAKAIEYFAGVLDCDPREIGGAS